MESLLIALSEMSSEENLSHPRLCNGVSFHELLRTRQGGGGGGGGGQVSRAVTAAEIVLEGDAILATEVSELHCLNT